MSCARVLGPGGRSMLKGATGGESQRGTNCAGWGGVGQTVAGGRNGWGCTKNKRGKKGTVHG